MQLLDVLGCHVAVIVIFNFKDALFKGSRLCDAKSFPHIRGASLSRVFERDIFIDPDAISTDSDVVWG